MTTYSGHIDRSPAGNSPHLNCIAGSGGVTQGKAVKFDGTTDRTVVACSAASDIACGIAAEDVSEGGAVKVYVNGATVETAYTLSTGGAVGLDSSGDIVDYSSDTYIGLCVENAGSASVVYINIQY